jgi:hypothetical protein
MVLVLLLGQLSVGLWWWATKWAQNMYRCGNSTKWRKINSASCRFVTKILAVCIHTALMVLVLLDLCVWDTPSVWRLPVSWTLLVRSIVMCDSRQLPLAASWFVVFTLPTQAHGGVAAGSDKRQVPNTIWAVYMHMITSVHCWKWNALYRYWPLCTHCAVQHGNVHIHTLWKCDILRYIVFCSLIRRRIICMLFSFVLSWNKKKTGT